jgi:hypothetical protein
VNLVLCMENMREFDIWFFSAPYIYSKVSLAYRGVKTSPIEGKYLLDTRESSHFIPNLSEDLQQCTYTVFSGYPGSHC